MLWILIPLLALIVLISIVRLPRLIVLSSITEYRFFSREKTYAKHLDRDSQIKVVLLWLILSVIPLSLEQPPLWQAMTLVLTASLLTGAMIDHRTGLLPFRIAAVIGVTALFYTSILTPVDVPKYLATGLLIGFSLHLINQIAWYLKRVTLLGGGDIALLVALSLCFSIIEISFIIWIASLTGLFESKLKRQSMIRFGPHLACAALCCWYLKVIL